MSFLHALKEKIRKGGTGSIIVLTLITGAIIRLGLLAEPSRVWWDASVYQGMARFIGSGGVFGAWEFFRPPLWPLILSAFSWMGPQGLETVAKILTVIASLGAVYATYHIGKTVGTRAGLVAAALLSFSVPLLSFSVIPMTESLSVLFVVLAALAFVRGRWFWAGLVAGLAFVTRFPTGLIVGILGISVLFVSWSGGGWIGYLKRVIGRGFAILGGFLVIAIPYLLSNYFLYGDALAPLVTGSGMITGFLWLYQGDTFFYVIKTIAANPVSVLAGIGLVSIAFRWKQVEEQGRRSLVVSVAAILVFLAYFSAQAHKEFRYIVPIFPFVFVLVGDGYAWISHRWKRAFQVTGALLLTGVAFAVSFALRFEQPIRSDAQAFRSFYMSLADVQPGARVISSTPAIAAYSPVLLVEGYNTWSQMASSYEEVKQSVGYVAIDSCELHACEPGNETQCKADEEAFLKRLSTEADLVYDTHTASCNLLVYKLHTSR